MMSALTPQEFGDFLQRIFQPRESDKNITLLVDLPGDKVPDSADWSERRQIAAKWFEMLKGLSQNFGFQAIDLLVYPNTGNHNADLPDTGYLISEAQLAWNWLEAPGFGSETNLRNKLANSQIVFALVELSATAPLKVLARDHGFRAASMPGFNRAMMPTLRIDFDEVHKRVMDIKQRLDLAESISMQFDVNSKIFDFSVDIRHRSGHASSGLVRERGTTWNVPSGESFIVPYEGELAERSRTDGILPVQFGDEVVLYEVKENRAVAVLSDGSTSRAESDRLQEEPAYGNIAEIGFGVLQAFGVQPVGSVLLDEKLGLHIAFGRSDHFGGTTAASDFSKPENVAHIDRIYLPELQDQIRVKSVIFHYPAGKVEQVMANQRYLI